MWHLSVVGSMSDQPSLDNGRP